ncbi:unnamed protein product, partial [Allacma fusca]
IAERKNFWLKAGRKCHPKFQ